MSKTGNSASMKATYSRPKIAIYGEFANLTAGGLGSITEGKMATPGMSADRQVRP